MHCQLSKTCDSTLTPHTTVWYRLSFICLPCALNLITSTGPAPEVKQRASSAVQQQVHINCEWWRLLLVDFRLLQKLSESGSLITSPVGQLVTITNHNRELLVPCALSKRTWVFFRNIFFFCFWLKQKEINSILQYLHPHPTTYSMKAIR